MPKAFDFSRFVVKPGSRVKLKQFDPAWDNADEYKRLGREVLKARADAILEKYQLQLSAAQELLWASDTHSVLLVLQAMDAAGKDGMVKHVMSGMNPQGCKVVSFKQPSTEELDHNFLWRIWKNVPERGQIAVFNRSHYEDVLITKVHPELLAKCKLPSGKDGVTCAHKPGSDKFWRGRYEDINAFEKHLSRSGTLIIKVFLHVSKEEQKRRFLERIDNPEKNWKFAASDVTERRFFDDYMRAYEEAMEATSTEHAPWYVVPADHKYVARAMVAQIMAESIAKLDLKWPKLGKEQLAGLAEAKRALMAE